MTNTSRRAFLRFVSSSALIIGFDPRSRRWVIDARSATPGWEALPRLDGALLFDEAAREAMSVDAGRTIKRMPSAVLRPRSVGDVVKIVQFANAHRLKVAMRGQAHSQYGQTLVEGGIVIDSPTLNGVRLVGSEAVDAQAGASWGEVTQATLAAGLTPPAMGNTMTLSVGGILSAGGWSNSSHLHGAVVDTVRQLEVVTGDGQLVTCSPQQNAELFEMVLAGMGQCALIVRARIALMRAPAAVVQANLHYDDFDTMIDDARRLALDGRLEHLGAYPVPKPGGKWGFRIDAGKFSDPPATPSLSQLTADLKLASIADERTVSFRDYLQREAANVAAIRAARAKNPRRSLFLALFVPLEASRELVEAVLATTTEATTLSRFGIHLMVNRKFTRPMLRLPEAEFTMSLWPLRSVPYDDAAALARATEANRSILEKMRARGGKAYPPYAPYFSRLEWQAHYGSLWPRVAAAKAKFDPNGVLSPGPGLLDAA